MLEADATGVFDKLDLLVTITVTSASVTDGCSCPRQMVFARPIVEIMVNLPRTAWCAASAVSSWIKNQQKRWDFQDPRRRLITRSAGARQWNYEVLPVKSSGFPICWMTYVLFASTEQCCVSCYICLRHTAYHGKTVTPLTKTPIGQVILK